jgi:hypothetical protein
VPLTFSAGGVVKAEEHGRLDAEAIADSLSSSTRKAPRSSTDPTDGCGLPASPFVAHASVTRTPCSTEVRQHAATKDPVVGMREDYEQGRAP